MFSMAKNRRGRGDQAKDSNNIERLHNWSGCVCMCRFPIDLRFRETPSLPLSLPRSWPVNVVSSRDRRERKRETEKERGGAALMDFWASSTLFLLFFYMLADVFSSRRVHDSVQRSASSLRIILRLDSDWLERHKNTPRQKNKKTKKEC